MRKTVKRVLSMMLAVAMCMGLAVNVMAAGTTNQTAVLEQYEAVLEQYEDEKAALENIRYILYETDRRIQRDGGPGLTPQTVSNELASLNQAYASYMDYFSHYGTVMSDAELFALLKDTKYIPKAGNETIVQYWNEKYKNLSNYIGVCSGDDYTVKENWPKELQKYRPMGEAALISDTDDSDWENEAQSAAELLYRYGLFEGDKNDDGTIDFRLSEIPDRIEAYIMWIKGFGEEDTAKTYYTDYVKRTSVYQARNSFSDVSDEEWQNYICFTVSRSVSVSTLSNYIGRNQGVCNRDFLVYIFYMITGGKRGNYKTFEEAYWGFAADRGISTWLTDTEKLRYGDIAIYILNALSLKRADGQPLVQNLVESGKLTQLEADALLSRSLTNAPVITATTSDFAEATTEEAANYLHELGLFGGVGTNEDGTTNYDLNRTPNRAEAITMLVRLLGKEAEAKAGTWDIPFTDVPEWAVPYVGYAYANGLTGGISATEFGSTNTATQAQYLTFILRAMGYKDGEDFVWDRAWELSDKLGMTDSTKQSGDFLRGDVAVISLKALVATPKSGKNLASSLMDAGVFTIENAVASNLIQSTPTNIPDMDITDTKKNEASTNDTQQNTTNDNTNVEYEDFTVTATNRGAIGWKVTTTDLVIPETFVGNGKYGTTKGTYYRVTAIGNYAFLYCDSLTSVKIPNSVMTIGTSAFEYCTSLTSVNIPNSVIEIDTDAFCHCELTAIEIPGSVLTIGKGAFMCCDSLETAKIYNGVETIGRSAFFGCSTLKNVQIPKSVTAIGASCFSGSGVENVYYGGSKEDWNKIQYADGYTNWSETGTMETAKNSGLTNIHYNSTLPD